MLNVRTRLPSARLRYHPTNQKFVDTIFLFCIIFDSLSLAHGAILAIAAKASDAFGGISTFASMPRGGHLTIITTTRSTLLLFFKRLFVLVAPVVLPAAVSWFHHFNWLTSNQCVLVGYDGHVERFCRPTELTLPQYTRYESVHAPSLIQLSSFVIAGSRHKESIFGNGLVASENLIVEWKESGWIFNAGASEKQPLTIRDFASYSNTVPGAKSEDSNVLTAYGFRRNDQKAKRHSGSRSPLPIGTALLVALNVGMFLWLWNSRVDPSQVALNGQIYQDFGRSLTGNLSHFELWHIGFNMMTLSSLGPDLEHAAGMIPLLLWTVSFLPVTTLVVVGLFQAHQRVRRASHPELSGTTLSDAFPSMVGFSGILFAWMVVSTLDGQRSCPIFFLPSVCFDTFELWGGGVRVSMAPLVQLVVLQVILPRVSFFGHLAGVIVGFVHHWKLFPSLEWFQPCVLFPALWMVGKYYCLRYRTVTSETVPTAIRSEGNFTTDDSLALVSGLSVLRACLVVHLLAHVTVLGILDGETASELQLIAMLSVLVHGGKEQKAEHRRDVFGVVGQAYVVLVLILLVTDGLTIGAWITTWGLWTNSTTTLVSLLIRDTVFIFTICLTVQVVNEAVHCGGTWRVIGWPIFQCFQPFGLWLVNWSGLAFVGRWLDRIVRSGSSRRQQLQQHLDNLDGGNTILPPLVVDAQKGIETTELV